MPKDRSWRRHCENKKVIQRLKYRSYKNWYRFHDVNGHLMPNRHWSDMIGTDLAHNYKSFTTDIWDSRYKVKWGKKHNKRYYSKDYWTRSKDNMRFIKDLQTYGLKPRNTRFQSELDL